MSVGGFIVIVRMNALHASLPFFLLLVTHAAPSDLVSRESVNSSSNASPTGKPEGEECVAPAFTQFPPDFLVGRRMGPELALLIHVLIVVYLFLCISILCVEHFMPSLDQMSRKLGLSEDVAGATLMAIGSSAPELFTSIIGQLRCLLNLLN